MKKLLLILLALLLATNTVYASEITVTVPNQNELVDGKYNVYVDISENNGFASLQVELFYNADTLICENVIAGEALKGMLTAFNPQTRGEVTSAVFSAASTSNVTASGNVATFVFEKPKVGNPEFKFALVEMMSADGKAVDCEIKITDNYGEIEEVTTIPSAPKPAVTPSKPKEEEKPKVTFSDLLNHWASEYVAEAVALGIVNGMPEGTFAPDKEMTRAEFATLLWNVAKKPQVDTMLAFSDVEKSDWFYAPIAWALKCGYINGVSESEFNPNSPITREQAITILHRYVGSPKAEETLESFTDRENVSSYALSALKWGVKNKIISGTSETELSPKMHATRAQLATLIVKYLKNK